MMGVYSLFCVAGDARMGFMRIPVNQSHFIIFIKCQYKTD